MGQLQALFHETSQSWINKAAVKGFHLCPLFAKQIWWGVTREAGGFMFRHTWNLDSAAYHMSNLTFCSPFSVFFLHQLLVFAMFLLHTLVPLFRNIVLSPLDLYLDSFICSCACFGNNACSFLYTFLFHKCTVMGRDSTNNMYAAVFCHSNF